MDRKDVDIILELAEERLSSKQREDVLGTIGHLSDGDSDLPEEWQQKCRAKVSEIRERGYPDEISGSARRLLEFLMTVAEADRGTDEIRERARAGLRYLLDPWDIIPDAVPGEGLTDDLYALAAVCGEIEGFLDHSSSGKPGENVTGFLSGPEIMEQMPEGAGQHYAGRAKEEGLLDGYQRRALYDIGRSHMMGWDLTDKQVSFFAEVIELLLNTPLPSSECGDTGCPHCDFLRDLQDTEQQT